MHETSLLERLRRDGLSVSLEPPDRLRVAGPAYVRRKWSATIKARKRELLSVLRKHRRYPPVTFAERSMPPEPDPEERPTMGANAYYVAVKLDPDGPVEVFDMIGPPDLAAATLAAARTFAQGAGCALGIAPRTGGLPPPLPERYQERERETGAGS